MQIAKLSDRCGCHHCVFCHRDGVNPIPQAVHNRGGRVSDVWVLISVGTKNIRICGTALFRNDAEAWTRSSHYHNAVRVPLGGLAEGEIKPVEWVEVEE